MTPSETHSDVGATAYFFIAPFPCRMGRSRNLRSFNVHWGDSPHRRAAERLMPGAIPVGVVMAVAAEDIALLEAETPAPNCELRTASSGVLARTYIPAESDEQLAAICKAIGGMSQIPAQSLTWPRRTALNLRWLWTRRPRIRIAFRGIS